MARQGDGPLRAIAWREALDTLFAALRAKRADGGVAILGSGFHTTEVAWLLARLANVLDTPHRSVWVDKGPVRHIPNTHGGISGSDAAPNRRGAELAGLVAPAGAIDAQQLLHGEGAANCSTLFVTDSDFGQAAHDPAVVARLRQARFLVVMGWADTPLAQAADLVLPSVHAAETSGTFVNVAGRLQRFERAFPPPSQARSGVEILADLLSRFDPKWAPVTPAIAFDLMCEEIPALAGLRWSGIPATGIPLDTGAREASA